MPLAPGRIELHGWVGRSRRPHPGRPARRRRGPDRHVVNCILVYGEDDADPDADGHPTTTPTRCPPGMIEPLAPQYDPAAIEAPLYRLVAGA